MQPFAIVIVTMVGVWIAARKMVIANDKDTQRAESAKYAVYCGA
jgi:hypothetical protein